MKIVLNINSIYNSFCRHCLLPTAGISIYAYVFLVLGRISDNVTSFLTPTTPFRKTATRLSGRFLYESECVPLPGHPTLSARTAAGLSTATVIEVNNLCDFGQLPLRYLRAEHRTIRKVIL